MTQQIKVLNRSDEKTFERELNELLSDGWKLHSSSCGFVPDATLDYCNCYQAIVIRDGESSKEIIDITKILSTARREVIFSPYAETFKETTKKLTSCITRLKGFE